MKKLCALALCLALCVGLLPSAAWAAGPEVKAKAVLLMEKSTGEILYEEHGEEPLELASVTKVMTMLLIMEALDGNTLPFINGGEGVHWVPEVPTWLSLAVIVLAIGGASVASVIKMKSMESAEKA